MVVSPEPTRSVKLSPPNENALVIPKFVEVAFTVLRPVMVEDAAVMTIPTEDVGEIPSRAAFFTQSGDAGPVALRTPFVTERPVPVMSVTTSPPSLNEPDTFMLVEVALVIVAFVPRSDARYALVAVRPVEEAFVDEAKVKWPVPETVSAVVDA